MPRAISDKPLGFNLRKERLILKITLKDLALKVGVSQGYLSHIEQEPKRLVGIKIRKKICKFFKKEFKI